MAVEKRRGTFKQYYTRVWRIGGKLKKSYVGRLSNPIVGVLIRDEKLRKAEEAARVAALIEEVETAKQSESRLIQIARSSDGWKVLLRLSNFQLRSTAMFPMPKKATTDLPKLQELTRVCRLANDGDQAANSQLNHWINAVPELLDQSINALELARETLLATFANESHETLALLRVKLEREADELVEAAEEDPLLKHYAEAVALAKMDLMRCSLARMRADADLYTMRYWEGALGRSQQRWSKISKAFQKATVEHAKIEGKSRSR